MDNKLLKYHRDQCISGIDGDLQCLVALEIY